MNLADRFSGVRVLVIGDVMLDRYWWGSVSRVSPEAPVPVVMHTSTTVAAGGAANVAANIAGLGAVPILIGIVGDDPESELFPQVLRDSGIDEHRLFSCQGRKTTVKTRIVAHNQQIVRLDQESTDDVQPEDKQSVVDEIEARINECSIVLISDYGKGFLSGDLLGRIIQAARRAGKLVLVDPKGRDYSKYSGANILTPNLREAAEACNVDPHQEDLIDFARLRILEELGLDALLITQGEKGMTVLRKDGPTHTLHATARNVYDVTGAGDTAIATLAAALGSEMELLDAAKAANLAAGIVVERIGTTPVDRDDLATISAEFGRYGSN